MNAPLWTIRFELFCYILVAIAGLAGLMKRRGFVLCAFVAALAYYRLSPWVITVPFIDFLQELPRFVTYFLAGSVVYLWRDVIPRSGRLCAMFLVILIATRGHGLQLIWPVLFPYCILYLGMTPRLPFLQFLEGNDISYGVYLYGWPVHQLVIHYFPTLGLIGSTPLAVVLTCLLAFASCAS